MAICHIFDGYWQYHWYIRQSKKELTKTGMWDILGIDKRE